MNKMYAFNQPHLSRRNCCLMSWTWIEGHQAPTSEVQQSFDETTLSPTLIKPTNWNEKLCLQFIPFDPQETQQQLTNSLKNRKVRPNESIKENDCRYKQSWNINWLILRREKCIHKPESWFETRPTESLAVCELLSSFAIFDRELDFSTVRIARGIGDCCSCSPGRMRSSTLGASEPTEALVVAESVLRVLVALKPVNPDFDIDCVDTPSLWS